MNERIRELAEQADPEHWHSRWYSGIRPRVMDPEIKKFAELIIQECIKINKEELSFNAFERLVNKYQEHFGVE
jgi:hypothetical protein